MGTLLRDIRHAARMLIRQPGFAAATIAVLALGIGANAAIFSLVNAFLLKPLVIDHPEELTGVYSRDRTKPDTYRGFSYPNYLDLRENNPVFTNLMAHNLVMVGLREGDATRRVFANVVSSNFFDTFGVKLFRGRTFTREEERPGAGIAVAILSYPLWQKYGADPVLLGKPLRINGHFYTIVGIAPRGFTGTTALISPTLYLPLGVYEAVNNGFSGRSRPLAARDTYDLIVVGRLRHGVTAQSADSQLAVVASRLERAYPAENKSQTFIARPLSRMSISTNPTTDSELLIPSMLLLAAAGVVLIIASLNVANMILARGAARRKEIAVRLALGGDRLRILRQLVTEGLLLALAGGAAGLAVAYWGTTAMVASLAVLSPIDLVYSGGPDLRVLLATLGFCGLSTLLFSLGPAWSQCRPDIVSGLKQGEYEESDRGKPRRLFSRRNMLVMSQLSLSLVLLTAAGLFVRSSLRVAQVEPGFRMDDGVIAEVDPSLAGYNETRGRQIYAALLDRLRAVPGVQSASVAATVPFGMISLGRSIQKDADSQTPVAVRYNIVGEDYFKTLGIPILRGRSFLAADSGMTRQVAVLDKLAAEKLWPKGDAVGKNIRMLHEDSTNQAEELEVVGVVGAIQENIVGADGPRPHVYVAFGQHYQADMNIHLRAARSGAQAQAALLESVRREIRAVDERLPLIALKTLRGHLESSFDLWIVKTGARMFGIFGAVALLVAMVGLYGVRAYTVARRTREIGIRMALGAGSGAALRMILREGLVLTAISTGIGLVLSLGVGKILASLLYGVSGVDPAVFLTAPVLLGAVSIVACYVPARRAARVDPMVALRHE